MYPEVVRNAVEQLGPEINFRIARERRISRAGNQAEFGIAGIARDEFCACVGKRRRGRALGGSSPVCG